jgi:two-component system KDP operon response regulator KdpE
MTPPTARPRVLVVDDEAPLHRFLGPALEAAGYAPLRATVVHGSEVRAQCAPPTSALT